MNAITVDPSSFIHGTISGSFDGSGYYTPVRFTEKQLEEYRKDKDFEVRASASAGMSFELRTDSCRIEFSFKVASGSSVDIYSFDLFLNGRLYAHQQGKISAVPDGFCSFALPEGHKEIQLYLPCLAKCSLSSITLHRATYCHNINHKKKILFMGDSITQGYIAEFPSFSFPAIIARRLGAELLNQSIGGDVFHPEIVSESCGWNPSYIVSLYGTNEWGKLNRQLFIEDSAAFFDNLEHSYPDVPVAVVSPIWRGDMETRHEDNTFPFDEADRLMEEEIDRHKDMFLIHGKALFPEIPELMQDGFLHPNDLGNIIYADRLYSLLPECWKN